MAEELRGVTWDLQGPQLNPWQGAQRLYLAGFKDAQLLTRMWATLEGESGRFLQAWHHNVARDAEGFIVRDAEGRMAVKSTDLGFIQKNVVHPKPILVTNEEAQPLADRLFSEHPELARGDESAEIAFRLYQDRAFQPWYAYTNGSYKRHLPAACDAVRDYLRMVFGLGAGPIRTGTAYIVGEVGPELFIP